MLMFSTINNQKYRDSLVNSDDSELIFDEEADLLKKYKYLEKIVELVSTGNSEIY